MGKGRKRQATAVKESSGALKKNPQRRNLNEPQAVAGRPDPPDFVESDELALGKWHHLCEVLEQLGVLSQTDHDLMAAYACSWSEWVKLIAIVRKEGHTVIGGTGGVIVNPSAREMDKAFGRLVKLVPEFGLSPSSRSRLSAAPKKEANPLNEYLEELANARRNN